MSVFKGQQLLGLTVILILASLGFWYGWRLFEFQTDDAYIAFRYVANWVAGLGPVFNPPPFVPVEGYTSFLWVTLLTVVWNIFGVEAPRAAQVLNPVFGFGTLCLTVLFVLRMRLWERLGAWWLAALALVLGGVLTNRTFLAWLSSGLETSLFCFLFTWWIYEATAPPPRQRRYWPMRLALSAALLALARPDGLLAVAGTCLIFFHLAIRGSRPSLGWLAASALPLLAVPTHLVWRLSTYGDWLPNTYYAKHLGAWPMAGWRYLASFVLEYGVYFWCLFACIWAARNLRMRLLDVWPFTPRKARGISQQVAVGVLLTHTAYYTINVGGDHFEYRVYCQLIPLLYVSLAGMAAHMGGPRLVLGALATLLLLSLPVPWIHWDQTRGLSTRKETFSLVSPVAPRFPGPVRPILQAWDTWQGWLIEHGVGLRHQEHKIFYQFELSNAPRVREPHRPRWDHRSIMIVGSIGVVGWMNPNTVIIDSMGLTDRIVARAPHKRTQETRVMAHDREVPFGYLRCLRIGQPRGTDRPWRRPEHVPLKDEEVRRCESTRWY